MALGGRGAMGLEGPAVVTAGSMTVGQVVEGQGACVSTSLACPPATDALVHWGLGPLDSATTAHKAGLMEQLYWLNQACGLYV